MIKVSVLLADGFEEIEALATVDLLRRAQIYVDTVSITDDYMVYGAHGINVRAEEIFKETDFSDSDMIVLPGGMPGTTRLSEHEGVQRVVKEFSDRSRYVAAICAAPKVLGELGLLKGRKITCYPTVEKEIKGAALLRTPVAADGNIITGQAAGSVMDFALELIETLAGKKKAQEVARAIVYRDYFKF